MQALNITFLNYIMLHLYMEWFLVVCTPGKISKLTFILTLSEPLTILLLMQVKQNYN